MDKGHIPHFDRWYELMIRNEGGRSSHPADAAAKTLPAIAEAQEKKVHTNRGVVWSTWQELTEGEYDDIEESYAAFLDMKLAQHKALAKAFYYKHSIFLIKNPIIAMFFLEEAWAGGYGAIKYHQREINEHWALLGSMKAPELTIDGLIGRKTARAINAVEGLKMWHILNRKEGEEMKGWKIDRYNAVIEKNPANRVFRRGWARRYKEFFELFEPAI